MIPVVDYIYAASFVRVVDGDTVHLMVDMGMHSYREESFRLARCNAPELSTPSGQLAKTFTFVWFSRATKLTIQTHKTDDWGRYIVEVWRQDGANLSDDLLSSGNAVPWP